jgi:dipeptidyl aminopeptidase/acylaminoacyl peptidase
MMGKSRLAVSGLLMLGLMGGAAAQESIPCPDPPLFDRQALSESGQRESAKLSPLGTWVAALVHGSDGARIVIAPRGEPTRERSLLAAPVSGIQQFEFTADERSVLLIADRAGDEQYRLYAADLADGALRALSPEGSQVAFERLGEASSRDVVVSINDRTPDYFDLVRIDIDSGQRTRVFENDRYSAFIVGNDLKPAMASRLEDDGGKTWYRFRDGKAEVFRRLGPADAIASGLGELSGDGRRLRFLDSSDRDFAALYSLDLSSGRVRRVHAGKADISAQVADPRTGAVHAVEIDPLMPRWQGLDRIGRRAFGSLTKRFDGLRLRVLSQTRDNSFWIVAVSGPTEPGATFVFDTATQAMTPWFRDWPHLDRERLAPMQARLVRARDGLMLPVYVTLPSTAPGCARAKAPRHPAVLWVHGGPWARDDWAFRIDHQLLANRGYAVVSVNYRGSIGFGKTFVNAGNLEWGRRMQEDLADAVDALATDGLVDRERIAIVGASYGGYATLAALAFTPDAYACGVSVVGPSDLASLIGSIPPYWAATRNLYLARVGNPDTAEGRALLASRSPLAAADRVRRPLLIVHGHNDPRVKEAESVRMAEAIQADGGRVTLLLFPDEGHGIARPDNERALSAIVERFLAQCIGGRAQPLGEALQGSSTTAPIGAEHIPGLAEAIDARIDAAK